VPDPGSIHYRRRWFYVLWVSLLLLSAGAWGLWEKPRRVEFASLSVTLRVRNAPPGTRVQVWAGPVAQWPGPAWSGQGLAQAELRADGYVALPLLRIQIGRRRWVKGYVPRYTWDLMMLRLTAPGEPARYFAYPLSEDIRMGVLRSGWRLSYDAAVAWGNLHTDGLAPKMP
jgi:hypothetical protein